MHTSESDRISTLAREALEEMRLSVRGLTGKPVRLADALADWRAEVTAMAAGTSVFLLLYAAALAWAWRSSR